MAGGEGALGSRDRPDAGWLSTKRIRSGTALNECQPYVVGCAE